ncbi:YbaB/EbfC family nucleoid-associated protein [Microbispora sp. SCL1-1]|jgi:DNA-binding protein YbaB|uniref:YbaB/EbfC family nucleoid-associated protein n=1 Tax=Microbispora hainanensis TaxID=568844 RepID=A0ABZ1SGW6_9ACTN|nr:MULTISPECIES: YbaB/EbfC family nucleoid-associated protein [Microbispora]NJP24191.1 YbaB/EbfC family nucleoid-associated protein [Microbispora sp. CL1-1]TQS14996.1 YbaB/EbfC family nucleoid-associated protein [Microbispora sp. SCL1-1]
MRNTAAFNEGREGDVAGLVREVQGRVGALADLLHTLSEEVIEGTDATGAVTARVTGAGHLLGLSIDPRAMRDLDHVAMSAAIQGAIGAARGATGERLTKAMEEFTADFGDAPPSGDPLAPYVQALLREE